VPGAVLAMPVSIELSLTALLWLAQPAVDPLPRLCPAPDADADAVASYYLIPKFLAMPPTRLLHLLLLV